MTLMSWVISAGRWGWPRSMEHNSLMLRHLLTYWVLLLNSRFVQATTWRLVASTLNGSFSSTDYLLVVRSTSLVVAYLLLLADRVPLIFFGGDLLGKDGGLGSIGLAGGDTFATNSFNLLDCKLGLLTLGITNFSVAPLDIDGWTSARWSGVTSFVERGLFLPTGVDGVGYGQKIWLSLNILF